MTYRLITDEELTQFYNNITLFVEWEQVTRLARNIWGPSVVSIKIYADTPYNDEYYEDIKISNWTVFDIEGKDITEYYDITNAWWTEKRNPPTLLWGNYMTEQEEEDFELVQNLFHELNVKNHPGVDWTNDYGLIGAFTCTYNVFDPPYRPQLYIQADLYVQPD